MAEHLLIYVWWFIMHFSYHLILTAMVRVVYLNIS